MRTEFENYLHDRLTWAVEYDGDASEWTQVFAVIDITLDDVAGEEFLDEETHVGVYLVRLMNDGHITWHKYIDAYNHTAEELAQLEFERLSEAYDEYLAS